MANIAIFASGSGTNYEALTEKFQGSTKHFVKLLICDKEGAFVIERAKKLGTPVEMINYKTNTKPEVEARILELLARYEIDIVFLAGFMRILSDDFIHRITIPFINLHPSLLPKYRGAHAIERAFESDDDEIGMSIHYVTEELDGGEVILQKAVKLRREAGLEAVEADVHALEHEYYPIVAAQLCDELDKSK